MDVAAGVAVGVLVAVGVGLGVGVGVFVGMRVGLGMGVGVGVEVGACDVNVTSMVSENPMTSLTKTVCAPAAMSLKTCLRMPSE